jgi:predicted outer membrane repeat protein
VPAFPYAGNYFKDRIAEESDGSIRVYRSCQGSARVDIFDANGFLLSPQGEVSLVRSSGGYLQGNGSVSAYSYQPVAAVVLETISIGGSSVSRVRQMTDVSGAVLTISYEPGTLNISRADFTDKNGTPVVIAARPALPGVYQLTYRSGGVDWVVDNMRFEKATELYMILMKMPAYLDEMKISRDALVNYLIVRPEIHLTREQSEREVLYRVSEPLDAWNTLGKVVMRQLNSGMLESFRVLSVSGAGVTIQALNGARSVLEFERASQRLISETFPNGVIRRYVYGQDRLAGYTEQQPNGDVLYYLGDQRQVGRKANGAALELWVGYPDQGQGLNLQDALAFAENNTVIHLAAGTYTMPPQTAKLINKTGVRILGSVDAMGNPNAVIEGTAGHRFAEITGGSVTFENLKFRNFKMAGEGGITSSGGVFNASRSNLTFDHVVFENNTAQSGGAIFASQSALVIKNCVFSHNTALSAGGAVRVNDEVSNPPSVVNVSGTRFERNHAGYYGAGGMDFRGKDLEATFTNNTFLLNTDLFMPADHRINPYLTHYQYEIRSPGNYYIDSDTNQTVLT